MGGGVVGLLAMGEGLQWGMVVSCSEQFSGWIEVTNDASWNVIGSCKNGKIVVLYFEMIF